MALTMKPAQFAQGLKMRRQAIDPKGVLLIVEGQSDRQSLMQILHEQVHVVVAGNKECALLAHAQLRRSGIEDSLFLVDCDGESNPAWLGHANLIVSTNRDIEADFHLVFDALVQVLLEYAAKRHEQVSVARTEATSLSNWIALVCGHFGAFVDSARSAKLNVRILDPKSGRRRRIDFRDIPNFEEWVQLGESRPGRVITEEDFLNVFPPILGWEEGAASRVADVIRVGRTKLCRLHGLSACGSCIVRRFSNGHNLVDLSARLISRNYDDTVTHDDIARRLRLAIDRSKLEGWETVRRIRRFEQYSSYRVLRDLRLS